MTPKGRKRGRVLTALGLLIVGVAVGALVWLLASPGASNSRALAQHALKIMPDPKPAVVNKENAPAMPGLNIRGQDVVGVLTISDFGRDFPVLSAMDKTAKLPGVYAGAANNGTLIIGVSSYLPGFSGLTSLQDGAQIRFTAVTGEQYTYRVLTAESIPAADASKLSSGDDWDLTLYTPSLSGVQFEIIRATAVVSE